jgi:hypothetical protein
MKAKGLYNLAVAFGSFNDYRYQSIAEERVATPRIGWRVTSSRSDQ